MQLTTAYAFYGRADNNVIHGNAIIVSGSYGLHIASSTDNLIYKNSFYYNHSSNHSYDPTHVQAYDSYGGNTWNTSEIGNYWYDWSSPDDNGNGIVDNPYPIDGGIGMQDERPLAEPPQIVPEIQFYL